MDLAQRLEIGTGRITERIKDALEELERDADREALNDPGANGITYAVAVIRRALEAHE